VNNPRRKSIIVNAYSLLLKRDENEYDSTRLEVEKSAGEIYEKEKLMTEKSNQSHP